MMERGPARRAVSHVIQNYVRAAPNAMLPMDLNWNSRGTAAERAPPD